MRQRPHQAQANCHLSDKWRYFANCMFAFFEKRAMWPDSLLMGCRVQVFDQSHKRFIPQNNCSENYVLFYVSTLLTLLVF